MNFEKKDLYVGLQVFASIYLFVMLYDMIDLGLKQLVFISYARFAFSVKIAIGGVIGSLFRNNQNLIKLVIGLVAICFFLILFLKGEFAYLLNVIIEGLIALKS